jgi:hypothetical protein
MMHAPQIDNLIQTFQRNPQMADAVGIAALLDVWELLKQIEVQGDDELRTLWLVADRGRIDDFADFEEYLAEGAVENRKEFEEEWLLYYPYPEKWYLLSVLEYRGEVYFYFDNKLTFHYTPEQVAEHSCHIEPAFLEWLRARVSDALERLKADSKGYNAWLSENLSFHKRYGKILRNHLWEIYPKDKDDFAFCANPQPRDALAKICSRKPGEPEVIAVSKMTAADFYRYCGLCYNAVFYTTESEPLSPKEKYLQHADGRDCGLRNIEEESTEAFENWFRYDAHCGGHPWEIARGGNSTHISLYVVKTEDGWSLRLAGKSRVRAPETLAMALALQAADAPFVLQDAEALFAMSQGADFLGIVPDFVPPRYCDGRFPEEDRIIDFMQLWTEQHDEIVSRAQWYPLSEWKLKR